MSSPASLEPLLAPAQAVIPSPRSTRAASLSDHKAPLAAAPRSERPPAQVERLSAALAPAPQSVLTARSSAEPPSPREVVGPTTARPPRSVARASTFVRRLPAIRASQRAGTRSIRAHGVPRPGRRLPSGAPPLGPLVSATVIRRNRPITTTARTSSIKTTVSTHVCRNEKSWSRRVVSAQPESHKLFSIQDRTAVRADVDFGGEIERQVFGMLALDDLLVFGEDSVIEVE